MDIFRYTFLFITRCAGKFYNYWNQCRQDKSWCKHGIELNPTKKWISRGLKLRGLTHNKISTPYLFYQRIGVIRYIHFYLLYTYVRLFWEWNTHAYGSCPHDFNIGFDITKSLAEKVKRIPVRRNQSIHRFIKAWTPYQTNKRFLPKLVLFLNKDLTHISDHPNAKAHKVRLCSQWYFHSNIDFAIWKAKATLFVWLHH